MKMLFDMAYYSILRCAFVFVGGGGGARFRFIAHSIRLGIWYGFLLISTLSNMHVYIAGLQILTQNLYDCESIIFSIVD